MLRKLLERLQLVLYTTGQELLSTQPQEYRLNPDDTIKLERSIFYACNRK